MQGEPSAYPGLDRPNGEQQQQKEAATAHQSALLDYERQIVQGLVEEDSLCIMSSGMGWQKVGIPCIMPVHCKHVQAWIMCGWAPPPPQHTIQAVAVLVHLQG